MKWYQPGPSTADQPRTAVDLGKPYEAPRPITEDQHRATFDKNYRRENPFLAGRNGLGASAAEETGSLGFPIGQALQRGWAGLHQSDLSSLLTNGGIGAAVGLGGAGLLSTLMENTGREPLGWKGKSLAGLLGVGAGALLTSQMRGGIKTAFAAASQSDTLLRAALVQKVAQSQDVDLSVRAQITAAIARLGGQDLQTLARVAATAAGAGIGALIARWLMGKGLISLALGSIVGGAAGFNLSRPKVNAFGRQSLDSYR